MNQFKQFLTAFLVKNRRQRFFESVAFFGAIAIDKLADRRVADWLEIAEGSFREAFELFFFAPFMAIGFWVASKVAPERNSTNSKQENRI